MGNLGNFLHGRERASRRFRMNDGHEFWPAAFDRVSDLLRLDNPAPRPFDLDHTRAAPLGHIDHACAEHPIDPDDDLIAWLDQVDEAKFHAGAARSAHRKRHLVFRQKNEAQHGFDFLHHLHENRIQMTDERR